jgi:hypothetical protein
MPVDTIAVVAIVTVAFTIFALGLAWAERATRKR